jgi:NADP-reducing hydrogenase subunit HndD
LGESSGAAVIFGASGGVMEAALRTAAHIVATQQHEQQQQQQQQAEQGKSNDNATAVVPVPVSVPATALDFYSLRGELAGVKVASIPGLGDVAVCNGIASAQRLLNVEGDEWKKKYVAIEVMTCVGGCLGGGGEPKSDDPLVLAKRTKAIYGIDKAQARRCSHENEQVQQLYTDFLGAPLGETSERLLHTTFSARHSDRELLGRFLDAVDRRDGAAVAALFVADKFPREQVVVNKSTGDDGDDAHAGTQAAIDTEEAEEVAEAAVAVWDTNTSAFGQIQGAKAIAHFIKTCLPPAKKGSFLQRHRLADAAAGTVVHAPNGETVRFELVTTGSGSGKRIVQLTRVPL